MDDITLLDVREKFPKSYKEFETWYLERESGLYPWLPIRNYWKDITDWMDINDLIIDINHVIRNTFYFEIFGKNEKMLFGSDTYENRELCESHGLMKLFELREQEL